MSPKRFVILEHDWDGVHYDLMFEADGRLRTWKIPAPPCAEPQPAVLIFDHRIDYLAYEGPVSGGRGTVKRWDSGATKAIRKANHRFGSSWKEQSTSARWSYGRFRAINGKSARRVETPDSILPRCHWREGRRCLGADTSAPPGQLLLNARLSS